MGPSSQGSMRTVKELGELGFVSAEGVKVRRKAASAFMLWIESAMLVGMVMMVPSGVYWSSGRRRDT